MLVMQKIGLVAGATGIVGLNLANHLAQQEDWTVYGISRRPFVSGGVRSITANLLDHSSVLAAIHKLEPTHVFITAWMRQPTEAENIRVNSAMVRNLLDALRPARSVRHVALVTGLN